jgi:hypothetical protein
MPDTYQQRLAKIKANYPRAYELWTDEEEMQLEALHKQGYSVAEIAQTLQRQPSAISSRLHKLPTAQNRPETKQPSPSAVTTATQLTAPPAETQWLFIDEAGDPTLFNRRGEPIIGTNGCSRFFILGRLGIEDPAGLAEALTTLRQELVTDPYFAGVPSFDPARQKTAVQFHAKDDLPEVRYMLFKLLRQQGSALQFHAVVADKQVLLEKETAKRQKQKSYKYNPDAIYDVLMQWLFSKFQGEANRYEIYVAKRGNRERNEAIQKALRNAEQALEQKYGVPHRWVESQSITTIADPKQTVCLQAVDYFLWAVQRFYELREDRFFNLLKPQVVEIHDLDFSETVGTLFTKQNPLTLSKRFSGKGRED